MRRIKVCNCVPRGLIGPLIGLIGVLIGLVGPLLGLSGFLLGLSGFLLGLSGFLNDPIECLKGLKHLCLDRFRDIWDLFKSEILK